MARFVLLDSGPLGLAVCRVGTKGLAEFELRLAELETAGVAILIPIVIDYEVRRELVRLGATTKLRKLNGLLDRFPSSPSRKRRGSARPSFGPCCDEWALQPAPTRASTPTPSSPDAPPRWDDRAMK